MRDITRIPIRFDRLLLIDKQALADGLFNAGVILAFLDSLHPWFLWFWGYYGSLFVAILMGLFYLVSKTLCRVPEKEGSFLLLLSIYSILRVYMFFVSANVTFASFVTVILHIFFYYILFRNGNKIRHSLHLISQLMAGVLLISMLGFVLYLIGFPLPGRDSVYGENLYSFTNYYLFLLDDRAMWAIIPRFQSVFLEPSHMGIACVFLLMTEIGRWRRWYNIVLIVATLISFSLEAYVLLFCLVFLSKWIQRKHFVRNLSIVALGFTTVVVGSFFYNDGDNMLNQLIVMRLEVDDGDVAGNNRTSATFDSEYESFLSSPDVFTGREMTEDWGNSGYKVFIYDNGLIGLFLLLMFYGAMLYNPRNVRPAFTALCLTFIHFIVRAHMTWASCIIPMYFMGQQFTMISPNLVNKETDASETNCQQ